MVLFSLYTLPQRLWCVFNNILFQIWKDIPKKLTIMTWHIFIKLNILGQICEQKEQIKAEIAKKAENLVYVDKK